MSLTSEGGGEVKNTRPFERIIILCIGLYRHTMNITGAQYNGRMYTMRCNTYSSIILVFQAG